MLQTINGIKINKEEGKTLSFIYQYHILLYFIMSTRSEDPADNIFRTTKLEDKIYQKVQLRPIMLAAALAAILPGAPITPPPGWAPAPQSTRRGTAV